MLRGILGSAGGPPVGGSGTPGTIPQFDAATTLKNSPLSVSGNNVVLAANANATIQAAAAAGQGFSLNSAPGNSGAGVLDCYLESPASGTACSNSVQGWNVLTTGYGATATVNATALVSGTRYTITTVGTTDFTTFGARSNTVGVSFVSTANGNAGSGSGVVVVGGVESARYVRIGSLVFLNITYSSSALWTSTYGTTTMTLPFVTNGVDSNGGCALVWSGGSVGGGLVAATSAGVGYIYLPSSALQTVRISGYYNVNS
jgi:hypothetical protein